MDYIKDGIAVRSGKTGMVLNGIDNKILELENLKKSILNNELINHPKQDKFHKIRNIHDHLENLENNEMTHDIHFDNLNLIKSELWELYERLIVDLYNKDRTYTLIQILGKLIDKGDSLK